MYCVAVNASVLLYIHIATPVPPQAHRVTHYGVEGELTAPSALKMARRRGRAKDHAVMRDQRSPCVSMEIIMEVFSCLSSRFTAFGIFVVPLRFLANVMSSPRLLL